MIVKIMDTSACDIIIMIRPTQNLRDDPGGLHEALRLHHVIEPGLLLLVVLGRPQLVSDADSPSSGDEDGRGSRGGAFVQEIRLHNPFHTGGLERFAVQETIEQSLAKVAYLRGLRGLRRRGDEFSLRRCRLQIFGALLPLSGPSPIIRDDFF